MNIKQKIAAVLAVLGLGGGLLVGAGQYYLPYQGGTGTQTAPTSGQLLIGTSTGVYVPAGLTAGTGVTITPGSGAITISATAGSGSGAVGLRAGFTGAFTTKPSLSFDAGGFNVDTSNVDGRVFLDYTNGPASRAMANTWTEQQTFSNAVLSTTAVNASVSGRFEVGTSGLWTNGTNVGIGTNTPKGKLTVAGTSAEIIASGSTNPALVINATNATNGTHGLFKIQGQSTAERLSFLNTTGTELMTMASAGGVGIGTTTVTEAKLTVQDATLPSIRIRNPGAGYGAYTALEFISATNGLTKPAFIMSNITGSFPFGLDLIFATGTRLSTEAAQEKMRINANGKIGVNNSSSAASALFNIKASASLDPLSVLASNGSTVLLRIGKTGAVEFAPTALVGIGTSNPTQSLQVTKNVAGQFDAIRIQNTNGGYGANTALSMTAATNGMVYPIVMEGNIDGTSSLYGMDYVFKTGNWLTTSPAIERLRITAHGRVGVNDSTPSTTFEVRGSASLDPLQVTASNGTTLLFKVGKTGNIQFADAAKVGIGTSSPAVPLQVNGGTSGSAWEAFRVVHTGAAYGSNPYIGILSTVNGITNPIQIVGEHDSTPSIYGMDFVFKTGTNLYNAPQEKFRINSDGKVSVNRTSPTNVFEVWGTSSFDPFLVASASGTTLLNVDKKGRTLMVNASTSQNFEIGTYPAIGSTADALCKGTTGVVSTNTGSPTCTVSSEKYKRNITQLTSSLDIIRELEPVTFINKGDPYNREHFGLVAEQVAQVEPRLVFYEVRRTLKTKVLDYMVENPKYEPKDEDYEVTLTNDPRGVKYEEVVGVLVGAMKEQQAQIDALDARLTALEGGKAGGPPFPQEQSFWSKVWQFIINIF